MHTLTTRRISRVGASEHKMAFMKIVLSFSVAIARVSSIRDGRLVHWWRWIAASKSRDIIVRSLSFQSMVLFPG